jgi:hypothetical protein
MAGSRHSPRKTRCVCTPDGPGGEKETGYLWDVALRQGRTVRNSGMAPNPTVGFGWSDGDQVPSADVRDPYVQRQKVFWTSKDQRELTLSSLPACPLNSVPQISSSN